MIRKLLKTVKNFGLLEIFIRIIFIEDNVFYCQSTLTKANIKQFEL